jgi:hypothetical protein
MPSKNRRWAVRSSGVFSRNDYILVGIFLLAALFYFRTHHEKYYPYAVVQETPVQTNVSNIPPFSLKEYTIRPVAEFDVKALVLSADHYSWDRESQLVPVDLALGWGPMSDGTILKDISISQGNRWYFYHWSKPIPISQNEIIAHSANMHLIPSTDAIAKKIKAVQKSDVVEFKGYLVNVVGQDGWRWNSSQSRTDTGDHSCELVWVNEFETVNPGSAQ